MKKILITLLALAISLSAGVCFGAKSTKFDTYYLKEAEEYYAIQKYSKAIKSYEKVFELTQNFEFAQYSQLKISDSYYLKKDYDKAIESYDAYLFFYDVNSSTTYVLLNLGLSYLQKKNNIKKTIYPMEQALKYFKLYESADPRRYKYNNVDKYVDIARDNIASHNNYIVEYYISKKKYSAALIRINENIALFQGLNSLEYTYYLGFLLYEKQNDYVNAHIYADLLNKYYPDSDYTKKANNMIQKI